MPDKPLTVVEKFRGRSGRTGADASADITYLASGSFDDTTIKLAVLRTAPSVWEDLPNLQPLVRRGIYKLDELGGGIWEVTVHYDKRTFGPLEPGEGRFTFRTTGGTQHILNSRRTVASYAPEGQTATDHNRAIGVQKHGIEGCDITVPVYEFSESHVIPAAGVTAAYKHLIFQLTGKVSATDFKGLADGETLFMGAEGEQQGQNGDWQMSFYFAGSKNQILDLPNITGIAKGGWEYLWVEYEDYDDTGAMGLGKRPAAAYVEEVYEQDDLALLGIGTV